MSMNLSGRAALVTGAGAGIGAATAAALVEHGAAVMLTDIDGSKAKAVAERLGGETAWAELDVRDSQRIYSVIDEIHDRWGALRIAVNNAGVGVSTPRRLHEWSDEEWNRVIGVNLDGAFKSARAELASMMANSPDDQGQRGSIIMMGSVGSLVGLPEAGTYVTAKHGLLGVTKSIAIDYAAYGIRANLLAPGYVDTAISHRTEEQIEHLSSKHPVGRLASPSEIASAVVFLASSEASFVTGAQFAVDGGYSAH